jgi:hypothetical protein
MAQRNEIHTGSIAGSVVVAGSGNTINAKLRAELGNKAPPAADTVDIHAEFAELRKVLEQLQTPDQGKIRRALDDAGEELAKPEANKAEIGGAIKTCPELCREIIGSGGRGDEARAAHP